MLREKPAAVPFCLPQILRGLPWESGHVEVLVTDCLSYSKPVVTCIGNLVITFTEDTADIYGKVLELFGYVHLEVSKTQNFPQYLPCCV